MKKYFFLVLFAAALLSCKDGINRPVKVEGGMVRGILEEDVLIYKGVPFAAPPVGELHGKELQPVVPWEGVLEADTFRAAAVQSAKDPEDPIWYKEFFADGEPEYSEDCMYLNIWAPAATVGSPAAKIPVAVWMHGGGFVQGYCFEKEMDGVEWAKRGVILVTIPYRLGKIGFEENGPLGLKDQVVALKWVRDNIEAFGGDPSNVTILGQSAGAISCKYLHTMPEAKDLFVRSIMQSGGGVNDMSWHPELPEGTGGEIIPEKVEEGCFDSKPIMMGWVAQDPDFLGRPTTTEFADILCSRSASRPIYVYSFNRNLPGEAEGEPDFGAFHSYELWYMFGTLSRCWRPFTEADYALSARMLDAWTSFAKNSDPGWEAYTLSGKYIEEFDVDSGFMPAFKEDFSSSVPQHFLLRHSPLRYYSGVHSFEEENTDVMLMRINPADSAGPMYGPEIYTPELTHFGTYSARIRMPRLTEVQPNVGIVTGLFTYLFTPGFGLSEIDFEWLLADPSLIYIGTWTSAPDDLDKLQRIERTVDLSKGEILYTTYRSYHDGFVYSAPAHHFDEADDAALSPRRIKAIEGYDASSQFYVYGFDWYPDRLRWWVEHPKTGEKIVLWDYQGTTPHFSGIPQSPSRYTLNFWHTENWAVETNPLSTEPPKYPYLLEADWMKYEPYEALNAEWRKQNNF